MVERRWKARKNTIFWLLVRMLYLYVYLVQFKPLMVWYRHVRCHGIGPI